MMTKGEFESLKPFHRGYAVYMLGAREDEPNVPDESNPYDPHTETMKAAEWNRGQRQAVIDAQDDS